MKILLRKALRTIIKNWVSFFSAFLMMFLSLLFYIGLQGTWQGMNSSLNRYIKHQNLADSWVQATNVNSEQMTQIQNITGIKRIQKSLYFDTNITFNNNNHSYNLTVSSVSGQSLSRLKAISKEKINNNSTGIFLNKEFADENLLEVGNSVLIKKNNALVKLRVEGMILSPDNIYYTGSSNFTTPQYKEYGYGVVSENTMKKYFMQESPKTNIKIDGQSGSKVEEKIRNILKNKFVTYSTRETNPNVSTAIDRVKQIRNLSLMFSALFALLAILAVYTTIQRLIFIQSKDIAILEGLGYKKNTITLYYSSYGFFIGLLAVGAAWLTSPILSSFVLKTQRTMFSLDTWKITYRIDSLLVCIGMISISVLSALLAANKNKSLTLADVLKGSIKSTTFYHHNFGSKLPLGYRWALRDSLQHPVRVLMSIIGVAGGIALIMVGLGTKDTMTHQITQSYGKEFTYNKLLQLNPQASSQIVQNLSKKVNGQLISTVYVSLDTKGKIVNKPMTIFEDKPNNSNFIKLKDSKGKPMLSEGIYVTEGIANELHLKLNDKVTVAPSMTSVKINLPIAGIIKARSIQSFYISRKTYERSGAGLFYPTAILTNNRSKISSSVVAQNIKLEQQQNNGINLVKNLESIFFLILSFGVILTIIICYNLGALGYMERERDYATLSVLGFNNQNIRHFAMVENIITTFVGIVIGLPFGFWFLSKYVTIFSNYEIMYYTYIRKENLLLSVAITVISSFITSAIMNQKLKKLDMAAALKGVE